MSDIVAFVKQRVTSKGVFNILSTVSRVYFKGAGTNLLAEGARISQKMSKQPAKYSIVAIETQTGCNYRCSFCPIGKIPMPSGRMSMELYLSILDQLRDFDGVIHLYLFNEPLLDKRIVEMARLAKERTKAKVELQTNGSRLTKELAEELTPYATLVVNEYRPDNEVLNKVKSFEMKDNIMKDNIILVERNPNATLTNRAGNVPGRPIVYLNNYCVRPFTQLYIAHDGRVVLCCQDWSFEEIMGDVTKNTIDEIWNGEKYRQFRTSLLNKERIGLCTKCDFPGV